MTRKWTLLAASVGLILMMLALAACGGSGGGSLSLEEYFKEVDELDATLSGRNDEIDAEIEQSNDVAEVHGYLKETVKEFQSFLDGLRDLEPPDVAADAHNRAVEGFEAFIPEYSGAVDSGSSAESMDEVFAPLGSLDSAGIGKAQVACLQLEKLANDNGVSVDYDCGAG